MHLFSAFALHRKPQYIVVAAASVEGVVYVHAYCKAAGLFSVLDFAENFFVVCMWLYDFDCGSAGNTDIFQFLIFSHADPVNSLGLCGCLGIYYHAVFCGVAQVGEGGCHNRCVKSTAVKLQLCRR